MATLSDILGEDLLRTLAGDRYFKRGEDYFGRNLVRSLAQDGEHISATVHGTHKYQVQLWLEDDELISECSCPLGDDNLFCKHCVAVGLTWIAEPPPYRAAGSKTSKKAKTTMQDLRDYLARQDRDDLVQLIMDRAMNDPAWREQLLLKTAAQREGGADIGTFRKSLRNAIATGDFVDYYEAGAYADGVQSVIDSLEDLLDNGYASDVTELSEDAISLLEDALNSVDDSSGHLNPIIEQVQELHLRACKIAKPNPKALAERLFQMELNSGFGFFRKALETYADVLGDEGFAVYQALVDAEWENLPTLNEKTRSTFNYRRSKLDRMKETLVAASGSLVDLVTVIAKDLSEPNRYFKIAQLYKEHGQTDTAIAWAERGVKVFATHTGPLGAFLIAEYEQQGRFEDAIQIVWNEFSNAPSLRLYQKLKQQADKANTWLPWREKTIDYIKKIASQSPTSRAFPYPIKYSLLVEIFLWEEDVDQAWQAAKIGGCSQNLWMKLAAARQANYPEDALSIYQPAIEPLIDQTNNLAYAEAVDLLIKVRELMCRLDRQVEFENILTKINTTYKRKRNFIQLLKKPGLNR